MRHSKKTRIGNLDGVGKSLDGVSHASSRIWLKLLSSFNQLIVGQQSEIDQGRLDGVDGIMHYSRSINLTFRYTR